MDISIEYCITCNYRPLAASLAIAVKKKTGIDTMLIGSNDAGAFEVRIDGELIFSKLKLNRFPDHREILESVSKKRLVGS